MNERSLVYFGIIINLRAINEKLSSGYEVERVDALPVSNIRSDSPTLIYVLKKETHNESTISKQYSWEGEE